jgi:predicted transcriptional regulator
MTYNKGSIGDFMKWTMTVAKDPTRAEEKPKHWFDSDASAAVAHGTKASPEAIVKLLSNDNLKLLKVIASREFASLSELATTVKRAEPNLSRTLKKFAEVGIIELVASGKSLSPRLTARRVTLDLDLVGMNSMVSLVDPAHR